MSAKHKLQYTHYITHKFNYLQTTTQLFRLCFSKNLKKITKKFEKSIYNLYLWSKIHQDNLQLSCPHKKFPP